LGEDVHHVVDLAETKPFGFMAFRPGPGAGGLFLTTNPGYLGLAARRVGVPVPIVEAAETANRQAVYGTVARIARACTGGPPLGERRVVVLGIGYKPGSGDHRNSPGTRLVEYLRPRVRDLVVVDPHVTEPPAGVELRVDLDHALLRDAGLIVAMVDHPSFDPDLLRRHADRLVDEAGVAVRWQREVVA
jgi:UDP-N-acetyl-D-mannosaminuronate dehydrogenase